MKGKGEPLLLPEKLFKLKETKGACYTTGLIYSCAPTDIRKENLPSGERGLQGSCLFASGNSASTLGDWKKQVLGHTQH